MENKQVMDQAKILIQVGDMQYLESLLTKHKITSPQHYQKLLSTLQAKHDFNIQHHLCKTGDLDVLTYFRSKIPTLSLDFVDPITGQNCLHYAVSRNHYSFVKHLLKNEPNVNINQAVTETGETPIFFALGKIKQNTDKIKMVKLLLDEAPNIQVGALNHDKKACYEVYNDQFGMDEAANMVEKRHLKGKDTSRGSNLYFKDLSQAQRNAIIDKATPKLEKQRIIEDQIFEAVGDLNYDDEIRNQIRLSQVLQERLKTMQSETIYDPLKFTDTEYLRKSLQKKLLEFSGTTLIQNIKNL